MKSKKDKGEDQSSDAADEKSEENDEWLPDEVGEGPTGHPLTDESSQFSDHPSHEQYIDDYEREVSDTILEPTQNDPANLAQSLAETLLQEIFAQNMNILQVTITKERVERNGSVTVINQEENIYYLESVLTLITDGETPTSRVFFSQSHVGQTNITKKNATRCEYSNRGAFYYDPMHLLQYPVHVHTSNESKFENFGQYHLDGGLFNSVMVDNGDVIDSLFEIFAAQVSCTINGTCCGILCCKTFPPFIQFKPTTEAQPTVTVKEATKSVWLAAASLFGLMGGILGVSAVAIACILVSKKLVKSARSHGKHKSDSWSSYTM
uniref:Uncharacterized protein n=1 Tax=Plectus sambesii TaxID=2011161 RepID=A0A914WDX5_9BILA